MLIFEELLLFLVFVAFCSGHTVPETCTYSFTVPNGGASCLPGGSIENGSNLEAVLTNQHALIEQHLSVITDKLSQLTSRFEEVKATETPEISNETIGTIYTRWGKASCPSTATKIYDGFAGKGHYTHGGGVNYLCLPQDPEFPTGSAGGHQSQSYIYGVEYERHN